MVVLTVLIMTILIIMMMIILILLMMMNIKKKRSIRALFKDFERDYYKPIRTDDGFAGRKNNYIEYKSKGDRYEN